MAFPVLLCPLSSFGYDDNVISLLWREVGFFCGKQPIIDRGLVNPFSSHAGDFNI